MGFLWMKVYSAHCTQNIVNINKTQYKQIYLKCYKLVYYRCVLVGRYQWPMGFTTFRLMMIYLIHKLHHYLQSWSSPWQIILNYLLKSEWVCWEHWQHQSSYMAVKHRLSKQRLQVHQCLWDELHVEDVTGLLLFTHHIQTSMITDGEIYFQRHSTQFFPHAAKVRFITLQASSKVISGWV